MYLWFSRNWWWLRMSWLRTNNIFLSLVHQTYSMVVSNQANFMLRRSIFTSSHLYKKRQGSKSALFLKESDLNVIKLILLDIGNHDHDACFDQLIFYSLVEDARSLILDIGVIYFVFQDFLSNRIPGNLPLTGASNPLMKKFYILTTKPKVKHWSIEILYHQNNFSEISCWQSILKFLYFQVELVRRRTPVLLQVYLTTGLFVIVSWISFIVPPEVVPGNGAANALFN